MLMHTQLAMVSRDQQTSQQSYDARPPPPGSGTGQRGLSSVALPQTAPASVAAVSGFGVENAGLPTAQHSVGLDAGSATRSMEQSAGPRKPMFGGELHDVGKVLRTISIVLPCAEE